MQDDILTLVEVVSEPEYGGVACDHEQSNLLSCREYEIKKCPIHAEWDEWTDWGACSEAGDEGLKTATRFEETPARFGGTPCEGEEVKTATCVVEPCPVDCVMTAWEDDAAGCSKTTLSAIRHS